MSRVLQRFSSLLWCGLLVIKRRIVESMDDNNIAVLISGIWLPKQPAYVGSLVNQIECKITLPFVPKSIFYATCGQKIGMVNLIAPKYFTFRSSLKTCLTE